MSQPISPLYTRPLPGGGYVAIEHVEDGDPAYRAQLRVERRADPLRRAGHAPPVIAERHGEEPDAVVDELRTIAASNVSVAQGIQRLQRQQKA